ncbi:MAG: hypothetical protein EXS25_09320 [Pedosphaera sp.]|nr:hypothetical protein [Pedosphaera sp.]
MVLCVGEVDLSIGTCSDPFGTVQGGFACFTTVSGKPFFPAAGLMLDSLAKFNRSTWLPSRRTNHNRPVGSKSIDRGPFNGVPTIGDPSGVGPGLPVPATVEIRPDLVSIRRKTLLPMSAM